MRLQVQKLKDGSKLAGIVGSRVGPNHDAPRYVMLVDGHCERIPEALLRDMKADGPNLIGTWVWKVSSLPTCYVLFVFSSGQDFHQRVRQTTCMHTSRGFFIVLRLLTNCIC